MNQQPISLKGRGAASNPANRFEEIRLERDEDWNPAEDPAPATQFFAFNEPGSSLASRTRVKTLAYDTILANKRFFGDREEDVPRMALTVGVSTVLDAREVVARNALDAGAVVDLHRCHRRRDFHKGAAKHAKSTAIFLALARRQDNGIRPELELDHPQCFSHIRCFKTLDMHALDLYHPKISDTDIGHNIVV